VTVIAQGSLLKPIITVCQDVRVTKESFNDFLEQFRKGLESIEDKMSQLKKGYTIHFNNN
jgi:predicted transcriptional regulator